MPRAVLNDCSIDFSRVDGFDDTPPPDATGAAAAFVLVGLGVTALVGAGLGVFVGSGVASARVYSSDVVSPWVQVCSSAWRYSSG